MREFSVIKQPYKREDKLNQDLSDGFQADLEMSEQVQAQVPGDVLLTNNVVDISDKEIKAIHATSTLSVDTKHDSGNKAQNSVSKHLFSSKPQKKVKFVIELPT